MTANRIALIIHAGAGSRLNFGHVAKIEKKLREIVREGYRFLKKHSAVETVVEAVRWLEDWPDTNAGTGAMLQSDGVARLSASLMDGHRLRFSGVINLESVRNPILVAHLLQEEHDRILASTGANWFAREKGFKSFDPRTEESLKHWRALRKKEKSGTYGTVGASALDRRGHLASATSSGGKGMEHVGRVSDSALPAGNFANSYAAISATGLGEDIVEEALASTIATRALDLKGLKKAFDATFREAERRKRKLAAIGVDRKGRVYWRHTTEILYYAFCNRSGRKTFPL